MRVTTLIFATNNQHKIDELQAAVGQQLQLITLRQAGINIDIPEPFHTLRENAAEKSRVIHELTGKDCFSEDTGLEVDAIGGAPGVHSARYAGEGKSSGDNIDKLLGALAGLSERSARFHTVISLLLNGRSYFFEGICEGNILTSGKGIAGFGYDPVFVPLGSEKSFAEMSLEEKNIFSHRKKAADQLIRFLHTQQTPHHG